MDEPYSEEKRAKVERLRKVLFDYSNIKRPPTTQRRRPDPQKITVNLGGVSGGSVLIVLGGDLLEREP